MRVEFARIDARDDVFTGYSPVGFVEGESPVRLGPQNGELHLFMKREYLTKLRALQLEIKAKYEPKFVVAGDEPVLNTYGCGNTKEDYLQIVANAEASFPGEEADYYT